MRGRRILILLLWLALGSRALRAEEPREASPCQLIMVQGQVMVAPAGDSTWQPARTNLVLLPGARVRTGTNGTALIRTRERSLHRLGPNSEARAMSPAANGVFRQFLERGLNYFFDREGGLEVNTTSSSGLTLGTEFVVRVEGEGDRETVEVTMFDGLVEFRNAAGKTNLSGTMQGRSEPGRAPFITSAIYATNVIQWCLYYPAVLDPEELTLPSESATVLTDVLAKYRSGDLVAAFEAWPTGRVRQSVAEEVLHAALLVGIGGVDAARDELRASHLGNDPLAAALQRVIAAVTLDRTGTAGSASSPSALLAESYFVQSLP